MAGSASREPVETGALVKAANSGPGIVLLNLVAASALALPSRFPASRSLRAAGAILAVAGAGLGFFSLRALGTNYSRSVRIQRRQKLVAAGPYARMRHPIYTANLAIYLGLSLLLASPLGLIVLVVLLVPRFLLVARYEERLLEKRFGEEYASWVSRTGRFLPGL